jgi:acetamidase/formamidase
MGLTEIRKVCEVSLETPAEKQPKLHNRWHPDIPVAATIKAGETVKIECVSSRIKARNEFKTYTPSRSTGRVGRSVIQRAVFKLCHNLTITKETMTVRMI